MTEPTDTPVPPAPPVDLMEQLGLRLRVSFPEFLALDDGPQAERKKRADQE
ncbi:hypothetical protein [Nocardioides sp. MH1]|uniref:hypothetical protein n=1 Tax=Nocardioides sp. MH1 TaxID=3242490 RepID=UPI0035220903